MNRMGRRARFSRMAVAAVAMSLVSAAAQAAGETTFALYGGVGVYEDENFFQNAFNVEQKTLGSVGLETKLHHQRPSLDFDLRYIPTFRREFDDPGLEADTHRLHLGLDKVFSASTSLRLREALHSSEQEDTFDFDLQEPVVVTRRTERFGHGLRLDLKHDLSERTALLAGAEHSIGEYESTVLADSEVVGVSLGFGRQVSRRAELSLLGRARRFDLSSGRDTDFQGLGFAYRREVARFHEVTAEAGVFRVEGPRRLAGGGIGPREEETGWYGGVAYTHGSAPPVVYSARLWREVAPGVGFGHATLADNATLTASTPGGRTLRLEGIASYARHTFLFGRDRATETLVGTARLHWYLKPEVRLSFGYSRVHQTSDFPALDHLDFSRYSAGIHFPLYRSGPRDEESPAL